MAILSNEEFERAVETTMRERGIERAEAEITVAMQHGELHNDLLSIRPLTAEQRRQLSRPLHEVMIELGELPAESADPPIDRSTALVAHERRSAD